MVRDRGLELWECWVCHLSLGQLHKPREAWFPLEMGWVPATASEGGRTIWIGCPPGPSQGQLLPVSRQQLQVSLHSQCSCPPFLPVFPQRRNESDLPENPAGAIKKYPLPCFTPGPQATHNISVIQAHLKETLQPDAVVLEELDKLKHANTPEPLVTAPASSASVYDRKIFILAVLQQFSTCMTDAHEAFTKSLEAKDKKC